MGAECETEREREREIENKDSKKKKEREGKKKGKTERNGQFTRIYLNKTVRILILPLLLSSGKFINITQRFDQRITRSLLCLYSVCVKCFRV